MTAERRDAATGGHRHTLDQLRVLDAIARTGSFAAAATALHRVPSAISHAMKALEDALGVSLFDRTGHRAALTSAGERLVEAARDELARADRFEATARQLHEGWEPELRVVLDAALPLEPLIFALRALESERVPTRVRVDVECQDGVRARFDEDDADIMLALEMDLGREGLTLTPLPPLTLRLLCAPSHGLAQAGSVTRDDLRRYTEVVVRDTSPRLARSPRPAFLGTPSVIYLSDFHGKRLALLQGVGFGWIPEHLALEDLAAGTLVEVPLAEGNRWTYHPQVAVRAARPPGRAGQRLLAALLDRAHGESDSRST
jgi:DNA-binding transcriptional LysR family regulator